MGTMADQTVLAAGVESANVLAGRTEEFTPGPAVITLYAAASIAATTCYFAVGNTVVVDDQDLSVIAAAGRIVIPDDMMGSPVGSTGGDRLILRFFNAAAATVTWRVQVDPA